jgi:ABC-type dipeptide/oligopeptide/nickel transport system permease subunit
MYGARTSLLVGIVAAGLAVTIGTLIGLLAGFFGRWTDMTLSRGADVMLAVPQLLISIGIVASCSTTKDGCLGGLIKPGLAGNLRIIGGDLLPNLAAPIIVLATLLIPQSILFEAALSYLGLGVPPDQASWGQILADASGLYDVAWWLMVFPGAFLVLTTLAFNLLGDGLRDALDVRTER